MGGGGREKILEGERCREEKGEKALGGKGGEKILGRKREKISGGGGGEKGEVP